MEDRLLNQRERRALVYGRRAVHHVPRSDGVARGEEVLMNRGGVIGFISLNAAEAVSLYFDPLRALARVIRHRPVDDPTDEITWRRAALNITLYEESLSAISIDVQPMDIPSESMGEPYLLGLDDA